MKSIVLTLFPNKFTGYIRPYQLFLMNKLEKDAYAGNLSSVFLP